MAQCSTHFRCSDFFRQCRIGVVLAPHQLRVNSVPTPFLLRFRFAPTSPRIDPSPRYPLLQTRTLISLHSGVPDSSSLADPHLARVTHGGVEMKIRNVFGTRFRGTIGKSLIASSWKGIAYVRAYAVPRNPRTELQQTNRQRFGETREAWRPLTAGEREAHDRAARGMSGWNLFVRERMLAAGGVKGRSLAVATYTIVDISLPRTHPEDARGARGVLHTSEREDEHEEPDRIQDTPEHEDRLRGRGPGEPALPVLLPESRRGRVPRNLEPLPRHRGGRDGPRVQAL